MESSAKHNERRRRYLRAQCAAPTVVNGAMGTLRGECRNLCVGGMFFDGLVAPIGQGVELSVDLPDGGTVRAAGEICYHRDDPGSGMGIRFTFLDQPAIVHIGRFVASKQDSPIPNIPW